MTTHLALTQQLAAAREDAERWREAAKHLSVWPGAGFTTHIEAWLPGRHRNVTAAIDAARAAGGEG